MGNPTGSSLPTGSLPTGSLPAGSLPTGSLPTGSLPTGSLPARYFHGMVHLFSQLWCKHSRNIRLNTIGEPKVFL